jgi:hypothetical protein
MSPLFDPARLIAFAQEYSPPVSECVRKLEILGKLLERDRDGTLSVLGELRVEQSFNERILAELFDYRTLFRSGAGHYHVDPQSRNPATGKYPDFKLGFFGPGSQEECRAFGELKAYGTDLDAPQSGNYAGVSPVQQSFQAIGPSPRERWVIVCNYNEIRLYSARDQSRYEKVSLTSTDTLDRFRILHSLFSFHTLLADKGCEAPLDRLLNERICMHVPQNGAPRLYHQVTLHGAEAVPPSFSRMEDAIISALAYVQTREYGPTWPRIPPGGDVGIVGDALHIRHADSGLETIIEATRTPALRVAEYAPLIDGEIYDESGKIWPIDTTELTRRICRFLVLAESFMVALKTPTTGHDRSATFHWTLSDIDNAQCHNAPVGWGEWPLRVQPGVSMMTRTHPPISFGGSRFRPAREAYYAMSQEAVRDLLFAFQKPGESGRVARFRPLEKHMKDFFAEDPLLGHWISS